MVTHDDLDHIWTTEPHAARALAAELRHDPAATRAFLEEVFDVELRGHATIGLEHGGSRLDICLSYDSLNIGIETKFAHEVTGKQIDLHMKHADRVLLVVLEREDAPSFVASKDRVEVVTWLEFLSNFEQSRLTGKDLERLEENTRARRKARQVFRSLEDKLSADGGWELKARSGNSGFPSFDIAGPRHDEARNGLFCQIEPGRGSITATRFTATVGARIDEDDLSLEQTEPPFWIRAMQVLQANESRLLASLPLRISSDETPRTYKGAPRAAPLVAEAWGLPLRYAKGYSDSYLGAKLLPVEAEHLRQYTEATYEFVQRLDAAIRATAAHDGADRKA